MELSPVTSLVRWTGAPRMIPSRYPVVGLLDRVASPADLDALFELEGWTNDRISNELGLLHTIPEQRVGHGRSRWRRVVMAAYCHPRPGGGRFSTEERGAWYAGRDDRDGARRVRVSPHGGASRGRRLRDGRADARLSRRLPRAVPRCAACAIAAWAPLYDPDDYSESQALARQLLQAGSNGVVYRSVRDPEGECIACFRPPLVRHVRAGGHYEFRWEGRPDPVIRKL